MPHAKPEDTSPIGWWKRGLNLIDTQPLGHEDSYRKTVAGVGEMLRDLLRDGKQPGAAPTNFAYHAHALAPTPGR